MKDIRNDPIDFVIPWIDPNDKEWQQRKQKYKGEMNEGEDGGSSRYRDMSTLRYLFRSLEKNASWVNKIHLVTCHQVPSWLNTDHPQINLVNHEDFIPAEYLPTFSSRAIEFNYHRIPGISNNIVCFNDDMFVIKETSEETFFINNLPCDAPCMCYAPVCDVKFLAPMINVIALNRHFRKRDIIRKDPLKWYNPKYGETMIRNMFLGPSSVFTGFTNAHIPFSIKKETLEELWAHEKGALQSACKHRFRNELDVNIWLATYWQYAKNEFVPRDPRIGCYIGLSDDLQQDEKLIKNALDSKAKLICLNDEIINDENFEKASKLAERYLQSLFPQKSGFEK